MATTTGSRSTIAGMMKLLCDGPSTTLIGKPRARGGGGDARIKLGSSLAAKTSAAPSRSASVKACRSIDQCRHAGGGDVRADIWGDDPQARRRLGEQAELLQRLLAAADDEHVAAVEIEEDREVPQRRTFRCLRAEHDDRLG